MTEVPTLGEMRQALADPAVPTLGEMAHANLLYQTDPDAYLEHYGIKGMKWGVRRSREVLGRLRGKKPSTDIKDGEGGVVGGIRAKSRAGAQKLKDMKEGSTIILEDADGATKVMSKQKDGTFKEVYLSADAERTLRTSKKAESELSDREINEAINRAKKIEEYNKIFAPNPNADLKAKVDALQLELDMKRIQAQLNPPKVGRVKRFIKGAETTYDAYQRFDKKSGGKLKEMMDEIIKDATSGKTTQASMAAKVAAAAAQARADSKSQARKDAEDRFWSGGDSYRDSPFAPRRGGDSYASTASNVRLGDAKVSSGDQQRVNDFVYNITSMGNQDPMNPYYSSPTATSVYPELEPRRN